MARRKSSSRWLKEHFDDDFVRRSKKEHYRSRAVYKLIELNEKEKLLQKGQVVLELGAAPGGWTQYIAEILDGTGVIIASDILTMDSFSGVRFIHGDFREQYVLDDLMNELGNSGADLVLSDMAPNLSGIPSVDQSRSIYLAELALDIAATVLMEKGCFVTKLFQGDGFDGYLKELRRQFKKVVIRKPKASRARSREVYAVALGRII